MVDTFVKILNMSITASWLILAVVLLRFILKKAPKWIAVLLWGIVALRLVVPFSFESALSLIPSAEIFNAHNIQYETPTISNDIPAVSNVVNPVLGEAFAPNPASSVNPPYVWTFILSVIWLTGIAVMLLYALISYVRVHRSVAERVPYEENIFLCDHVKSPFILGLIRPRIYLPPSMDVSSMEPVIAHEKAHLARRDHWWKPLGFLILAVHWFNPLCWVAYVLLCRDIELACDEKVIRNMDVDGKKQYSVALLECSSGRRLVAICPLAFGEVAVKERVKKVLNYKIPAYWVIVSAIVACALVAVCFATNPMTAEPGKSDGKISDSVNDRNTPDAQSAINISNSSNYDTPDTEIDGTSIFNDISTARLGIDQIATSNGTSAWYDYFVTTDDCPAYHVMIENTGEYSIQVLVKRGNASSRDVMAGPKTIAPGEQCIIEMTTDNEGNSPGRRWIVINPNKDGDAFEANVQVRTASSSI